MTTGPEVRWAMLPLADDDRLRALELVSPAELERHRRDPTDAFLLGRLLLRELISELTDAPAIVTAACDECGEEHGRPQTPGRFASVSHTDDLVVVAVSDLPVGVDAERADASVPPEFARDAAGWTRIEAVLKAAGHGLRRDPGDVSVSGDAASLDRVDYTLTEVAADPRYVIAVARAAVSR